MSHYLLVRLASAFCGARQSLPPPRGGSRRPHTPPLALAAAAVATLLSLVAPAAWGQESQQGSFVKYVITSNYTCDSNVVTTESTDRLSPIPFNWTCYGHGWKGQIEVTAPSSTPPATRSADGKNWEFQSSFDVPVKVTGTWTTVNDPNRAPSSGDLTVSVNVGLLDSVCSLPTDSRNGVAAGATLQLSASGTCSFTKMLADPETGGGLALTAVNFAWGDPTAQAAAYVTHVFALYSFTGLALDTRLAARGSKLKIRISGQGFTSDAQVAFLGTSGSAPDSQLALTAVTVVDPNHIEADLDVSSTADVGPRTLRVTQGGSEQTLQGALNVVDVTWDVNQGFDGTGESARIANHPTVVRGFVQSTVEIPRLTGLLYVFQGESQISGSPFSPGRPGPDPPLRNVLDVKPTPSDEDKFFLRDSLNFYFGKGVPGGGDLPAGDYDFYLAVNPKDPTTAPAAQAGVSRGTFTSGRDAIKVNLFPTYGFRTTLPFRVAFVPDPRMSLATKQAVLAELPAAQRYLAGAYPVDGSLLRFDVLDTVPEDARLIAPYSSFLDRGIQTNSYLSKALGILNRQAASSGAAPYDRLVLVAGDLGPGKPTDLLAGGNGLANTSTNDTAIILTGRPATLSHEIGHTFGFGETYCGPTCGRSAGLGDFFTCVYTAVNCRRLNAVNDTFATGNPVEAGAVRLVPLAVRAAVGASASVAASGSPAYNLRFQRVDLMGEVGFDDDRWPDLVEWKHLASSFRPGAGREGSQRAAGAAGADVLSVHGLIDTAGTVTLIEVVRTTAAGGASPEGGDLVAELLDASGTPLSAKSAAISFVQADYGLSSSTGFAFNLPYQPGARQLRIRQGARTLATRSLSPNAPSVQVQSPSASQTVSGSTTIQWSGTDPDGDALTYSVFYTPDGTRLIPIASELSATSYSWNPAGYPGGTSARILVVASDGTNEGRGQSGAFTVAKGSPRVTIVSPAGGTAFPAGTDVVLQGVGLDPEDGLLPPSSLSFRSNVAGSLGTGSSVVASLAAGQHTITLRGVDRDGNASEASITITIGAADSVPVADSLSPSSGPAGTVVTISGKNFDSAATVTFGQTAATVTSASATQLTARVPQGLATGPVPVTVTSKGFTAPALSFRVTLGKPRIDTISPASAPAGTPVVIRGSEFEAVPSSNVVRFGSVAATVLAGDTGSLVVPVPPLPAGATTVTVTTSLAASDGVAFTVTGGTPAGPVVLTSISPPAAPAGSPVTITGSGFSAVVTANAVAFGNLTTTPTAATPTSLTVTVPPDAPSGGMTVVVTVNGFPSNPLPFTVGTAPSGPDIGVSPMSLNFGKVAVGSSSDLSVSVSNPGTGSLTVTSLSVTGAAFALVSPAAPFSVAAGAQQAVTVRFAPTSSGAQTGTLTISHNVSGKSAVAVALAGEGTTAGPASTVFIPVILSSPGASGSYFTSELTFTNRGTTDASVELVYTASAGGGSGTGVDRLGAGKQRTVPDAVEYLRSLGVPIPAAGARVGTLLVRFTDLSSPNAGAATVRTTTPVPPGKPPTGRAGLAYPGVPNTALLSGTAWICGLRQDAKDRSNVAIVNAGAAGSGDVTLRLTVVSGDPSLPLSVALPDETLSPGGFKQFSGVLLTSTLALTNGYVKVERVGGTAPFYAYGVINDQANSDGSFVPPLVPSTLTGKAGLTIPVAVEAGAFTTEIVLANLGSAQRTVQLTYVASAIASTDHAATVGLTLAPHEQRAIPAFVDFLRSLHILGVGPAGATFTGPVFVTSSPDVSDLFAGARTATPGDGGRYGLFYTAVPFGGAATGSAWLGGLLQDAENRTNLALVNTGEADGSPSSFRVELFDGATGSLVHVVDGLVVPARGFFQIGTILAQYAPGTSNAYARVTRASGSNPFIAYAVVNDGAGPGLRSGDGAFVAMEKGTDAGGQPSSGNLLANPGAEEGDASPDGTTSVSIPGWTVAGGFTVVRYGTPTFPDEKASSDISGGQKFFYGGEHGDLSWAEQVVSVASRAADIDAGNVTLNVSADTGTYDDSGSDAAFIPIEFLDAAGNVLGHLELGPYVDANNRLARVQATVPVPRGTRSLSVQLLALGSEGVAYVYFDNVSVSLSR